jgi:putative FmdB family regulatory protein
VPTYQYACTNPEDKHEFEVVQSFSDPSLTECPTCGSPVRKVYGSVGVVFKGSGFYRTDSRAGAKSGDGGPSSGSAKESPAAAKESGGSSSSSGSSEGSKGGSKGGSASGGSSSGGSSGSSTAASGSKAG